MKIPLLSRLFQPRAGPQNTWGSAYSFLFGTSTSGKTVNERTAMQTTAVYACVRILAETIASLPLHTYRHTTSGKEKATDHPMSEWYSPKVYRIGPVTKPVTDAIYTEVCFSNFGRMYQPWSVCNIFGGRDAANNVTITWVRRDRIREFDLGHQKTFRTR